MAGGVGRRGRVLPIPPGLLQPGRGGGDIHRATSFFLYFPFTYDSLVSGAKKDSLRGVCVCVCVCVRACAMFGVD